MSKPISLTEMEQRLEESVGDPEELRELQRRIARLDRELEKRKNGVAIIRDTIRDIFKEPPRLKVPVLPAASLSDKPIETACAHLSDLQLGKKTLTYNISVARDRILHFGTKIVEITKRRRKTATIDQLSLYLGGDMVEGEDIFPHQAHLIDVNLLEQAVRTGPLIIIELILYLLKHFPRIKVYSVPGNHGKASRTAHPETNWDTVLGDVVQIGLLGPSVAPREEFIGRLTMEVAPDFYCLDRLPGGWGNLIVHGHQISGGSTGLPFNGVKNAIAGWADVIEEPWDYLWFGHFHTFGSLVVNNRLWLANGSTESDNSWAKAKIKSAHVPGQRLAFFNESHGLIADAQIFLTERHNQAERYEHGRDQASQSVEEA